MEKYRRFADHGTGIQPFIPARVPSSAAQRFVVAPLLTLLRVPVVLLLALLWVLPFGLLLPGVVGAVVPGLGQLLRRLCLAPGVQVILTILGVFTTEKSWPLTTATAGKTEAFAPGAGDVVLVNFASYMDVLLHTARYAPVFAFAHDEGFEGPPRVITKGVYGALKYAAATYDAQKAEFAHVPAELSDAVKVAAARGAPLVLFFEGTPTNGKGVLSCPDKLLATLPAGSKVYLHALVYGDQDAHVPYVSLGSAAAHVATIVARPSSRVKSVTVLPSKTPQRATLPDAALLQKTLVAKLCEASGLRALVLKRSDKAGFLAHWKETGGDAYLK